MPNGDEAHEEIVELRRRLNEARVDGAKIVHALNCATQLIEALLAWMPEGMVLSPDVKSAKGAWSEAMQTVIRSRPGDP